MVAGADARSFSAGVENVRYEGPLKLEIAIPLEVTHQFNFDEQKTLTCYAKPE